MLVYVGPIVLKGVITDEYYFHFFCLYVTFRILLSPHSSINCIDFTEKLLVYFVETFKELYGTQFSSLNRHG